MSGNPIGKEAASVEPAKTELKPPQNAAREAIAESMLEKRISDGWLLPSMAESKDVARKMIIEAETVSSGVG